MLGFSPYNTAGTTPHYYVCAMFCQDSEGPGYIKFGLTGSLTNRLTSLRVACPVPVKMFAYCDIGPNRALARKAEKAILAQFEYRKIKGEWFRFDFSDPDDKRDFNQGTKGALISVIGPNHEWWQKINVGSLDALRDERRKEFCRSRAGRKILRKQDSERKFKAENGLNQ